MNQQQMPQEQPKVEELSKHRKYKLKENGDVILTESVVTEVTFKARQFISYKRQYDKGIEDMTKQLSKEHLEEIKKHKTTLEDQLKPITPIYEKVDKIIEQTEDKIDKIIEKTEEKDEDKVAKIKEKIAGKLAEVRAELDELIEPIKDVEKKLGFFSRIFAWLNRLWARIVTLFGCIT